MQYMLLIYEAEGRLTPEKRAACMVESLGVCDELIAQGKFIDSSPLQPTKTATTVRVRNGQTLVTDGPFAETHEVLGGYYLIRADSRDEAIRIAARHPGARVASVEVRRAFDLSGLRAGKKIRTAVETRAPQTTTG
jgi:hypothetical protein